MITENDIGMIIIDGKKSRKYERRIKKLFTYKMISMRKLRTVNDHGYPALRVADAIAGLIRYTNEQPNVIVATQLYRLIQKKISIIIEY